MDELERFDELETALTAVIAGRDVPADVGEEVRDLARIAAHLLGLPAEDFRSRLKARLTAGGREPEPEPEPSSSPVREGYPTVTPYITVAGPARMVEFVKAAFGAEELGRSSGGSGGGLHVELRIGSSPLMLGGFPGMPYPETPTALHHYVPDADDAYRRAIAAGATSLYAPTDQPYGDREAGVKDPFGNVWYLATRRGESGFAPEGFRSVTPYFHPRGAADFMRFLTEAFGAKVLESDLSPDGAVRHGTVRIGDSVLEMGEAQGAFGPMPSMMYLYVDDADAWYARAVRAGGRPHQPPADAPYGERTAAVRDAFGNLWYVATPLARRGGSR